MAVRVPPAWEGGRPTPPTEEPRPLYQQVATRVPPRLGMGLPHTSESYNLDNSHAHSCKMIFYFLLMMLMMLWLVPQTPKNLLKPSNMSGFKPITQCCCLCAAPVSVFTRCIILLYRLLLWGRWRTGLGRHSEICALCC